MIKMVLNKNFDREKKTNILSNIIKSPFGAIIIMFILVSILLFTQVIWLHIMALIFIGIITFLHLKFNENIYTN